ncbi:MAG: sensor histidine kinase [Thermodesulfobacteriota bacterium]
MHILCVDDESSIRLTIEAYLEDLGHRVTLAKDGREGIGLIESEDFDAVLLDLAMPAMSGLEVLARVTTSRPLLPVVVVSGTGNIKEVIQALRLGAWDFITKPIEDMAILLHSLDKATERARLLKENQLHRERLESLVEERTRALSQEIAERKAVENALRGSLAEKEVLLKEIHHRVKNNLQIVSSLLSLQALRFEGETASAFQDSQSRVRAMALVHEKLYRTKDLSRIDFRAYLEELTGFLVQAYSPRGTSVSVSIQCGELFLGVDTAIPCGLILNELVTNALKHAFRGLHAGSITISAAIEGEYVRLTVHDDGRSLPAGFDIEKLDSLGLQLVSNLARQTKGTLTVETRPNGKTFALVFPAETAP